MNRVIRIYVMLVIVNSTLVAWGDTGKYDPQAAEIKSLRETIEKQRVEIQQLKTKIAELYGDARLPEVAAPTTAPVTAEVTEASRTRDQKKLPKTIVFLRLSNSNDVRDEIIRAVNGLQPGQFFNVVYPDGMQVVPYAQNMIEATAKNRAKYSLETSKQWLIFGCRDVLATFAGATKGGPEVLWVVGAGPEETPELIKSFRRLVAGKPTRYNTTVAFGSMTPLQKHFLWRIAKETGGICIDANGEEIDEPALPIKVEIQVEPQKPKPSILKN